MYRYTLKDLSMLTDLSELEIQKILTLHGVSENKETGEKCFSTDALKALFSHLQEQIISGSSWQLFSQHTDENLRKQILTYHLADILTDSERARLLNLPKGCRIRERAKILAPENFKCGENVWIGEGAIIDAQGGLEIGDNSQIGLSVMVWSHTSHKQTIAGLTGSKIKEGIEYKRTRIGKNVFIAGPSVIAYGVTIGDGVIISPLTFVTRDIPAGTVVNEHREVHLLERRITKLEKKIADMNNGTG